MVFLCTFEFYCNKITSTNSKVVICMQQPMRRLETLVFKFWHFFYFFVHVNSHVQSKAIYCSQFVFYLGIENIGYTYLWVYLEMYIISNLTSSHVSFWIILRTSLERVSSRTESLSKTSLGKCTAQNCSLKTDTVQRRQIELKNCH